MNTATISLISGFVGAIIGAAGSVLTILIREHYQSKRDRVRVAADLAMRDFELAMEHSKRIPGKFQVYPLTSYLLYHRKLLGILEKRDASPEELKKVFDEHKRIDSLIEEAQK